MEYKNLKIGNQELLISRLCFGCEPLGGVDWGAINIDEIKRALVSSLELGWNFIDTAAIYGLGASETRIGEVTQLKAHQAIVATKIGIEPIDQTNENSRATVIRALDPNLLTKQIWSSIERLQANYLPLVYLHYPDKNCNPKAVTEIISKFMKEGLIGGYGLSNFNLDDIKKFHSLLPISAIQLECSMLDIERHAEVTQLVEWCKKNHVISVAYGVLKKGLLSGKFSLKHPAFDQKDRRSRLDIFKGEGYTRNIERIEKIKYIINPLGYNLTAVSIRYILDVMNIDVAIVGIKNNTQLIENNQASQICLHGELVNLINKCLIEKEFIQSN